MSWRWLHSFESAYLCSLFSNPLLEIKCTIMYSCLSLPFPQFWKLGSRLPISNSRVFHWQWDFLKKEIWTVNLKSYLQTLKTWKCFWDLTKWNIRVLSSCPSPVWMKSLFLPILSSFSDLDKTEEMKSRLLLSPGHFVTSCLAIPEMSPTQPSCYCCSN